jgi:hypothetical protein
MKNSIEKMIRNDIAEGKKVEKIESDEIVIYVVGDPSLEACRKAAQIWWDSTTKLIREGKVKVGDRV